MNRTLLGLAVMVAALSATISRADDCGPRPGFAPQGYRHDQGQYQLQTQQVWVPGTQEQVWVPGACNRWSCNPGSYQYVATAGHYENRQEWVWVAHQYQPRQQYGVTINYGRNNYGRSDYGRGGYGRIDFGRNGRHGAVPVGRR